MSQLCKQQVTRCKDVESWIRRTDELYWGYEVLSDRNRNFILDLYTLMMLVWLDVSFNPELLGRRWVSSLCCEPVDKVVGLLKDIDFQLIAGCPTASSFKHWRKTNYPWAGQLLAPLQGNIARFYETGEGLGPLRTCLRFITRANFPEPLGLEEEAFATWQDVCLAKPNDVELSEEEEIISQIFPRSKSWLRVADFYPRFGPGATNNRNVHSLAEKYKDFADDALLRYSARKVGYPTDVLPRRKADGLERWHEIQFVPKQLDKMRVVSKEPCSLMFYQLGVFDYMNDRFHHSRWSDHINLERADLNRDLAWEGSLTGEYATIDLSSASDSVRFAHVRSLFHKTDLREILIGTRSNKALYKGESYTPTYFGPMGAGTTFTVETAFFASVVDAVMHRNADRRAWRVYGDDIILPTDRAEELMDRLTTIGFTVNREKSFYNPSCGFRESCGGDYFKGEDVRPVMVSRTGFSGLSPRIAKSPTTMLGLIDLANELFRFKSARMRVLEALQAAKPGWMFSTDGEGSLWSPQPTNFHLKSRFNPNLQSDEVFACTVRCSNKPPKERYPEEDEDIRLFEWFRARQRSSVPLDFGRTELVPPNPPRLRGRWQQPAAGWVAPRKGGKGDKAL